MPGTGRCPEDAIEIVEIHPMPRQEKKAAMLAGCPHVVERRRDRIVGTVDVGLEQPAGRIVRLASLHGTDAGAKRDQLIPGETVDIASDMNSVGLGLGLCGSNDDPSGAQRSEAAHCLKKSPPSRHVFLLQFVVPRSIEGPAGCQACLRSGNKVPGQGRSRCRTGLFDLCWPGPSSRCSAYGCGPAHMECPKAGPVTGTNSAIRERPVDLLSRSHEVRLAAPIAGRAARHLPRRDRTPRTQASSQMHK